MALEEAPAAAICRARGKPRLRRCSGGRRHAAAQRLRAVILIGANPSTAHARRAAAGRAAGARVRERRRQCHARANEQRQENAPVHQSSRHRSPCSKFSREPNIAQIWGAVAPAKTPVDRNIVGHGGAPEATLSGQVTGEAPNGHSLDCRRAAPKYFVITLDAIGRRIGSASRLSLTDEEKHMSRLSLFNSPLLLGFDHFERALDRVSKISSDGYPPYNIEQLGENALRITLAVAGFAMGDLKLTIEDNQLVVRGRQTDDDARISLPRGIAPRQFQRSFVLAEGIEVRGAWLDNGLLHIDLVRPTIEARVRSVPIRGPEPNGVGGDGSRP